MNLKIIFLCIAISTNLTYGSEKFILMTFLYNETKLERAKEYIECITRNLLHDQIESIHVLYDVNKDTDKNLLHKFLKSRNISIVYMRGRPSFSQCFNIANTWYPNKRIILANADIYFNETLHMLDNFDLINKMLALTRWNILQDGSLELHPCNYSQDTWIFQTPFPTSQAYNITLGLPTCDGKIAYHIKNNNIPIFNPCKSIQTCHLHISGIRDYAPQNLSVDTLPLDPITLDEAQKG